MLDGRTGFSAGTDAVTEGDRRIHVVEPPLNQIKPSWKEVWDMARELVQKGELSQASLHYNTLLKLKPGIEEAKWEYCKILMDLQDWETATLHLERLVELDPARNDYRISAGTAALKQANFLLAIQHFGHVYERNPLGDHSLAALRGLIAGLEGEGKKENAFLMMEQLFLRDGADPELVHKLALLAEELGMSEKARFYYVRLVNEHGGSVENATLLRAALLHETGGDDETAVFFREKYLERRPDSLPSRKKAAEHYLKTGRRSLALPQLLVRSKTEGGDGDTLRVIGRIYRYDEKRPDKALHYFEDYHTAHPDDEETNREISRIRVQLADNFLPIVEGGGASRLWPDLARITRNPRAVYLAMADMLESSGSEKELAEVLEVVYARNPEDYMTALRLAKLYKKRKNYAESLRRLEGISAYAAEIPEAPLMEAEINALLGDEAGALLSYLRYLQRKPNDEKIRTASLELAGQLGFVEELRSAFGRHGKGYSTEENFSELDRLYLEGLNGNGFFTEADEHYKVLLGETPPDCPAGVRIRFHRADMLLARGRLHEAGEVVRRILADNIEVETALEKLTQIALDDQRLAWARSWFSSLIGLVGIEYVLPNADQWPERLFLLHVDLLNAETRHSLAVRTLEKFLAKTDLRKGSERKLRFCLKLVRLYFQHGEYDKCRRLVRRVLNEYPQHIEILAISGLLDGRDADGASAENAAPHPPRVTEILRRAFLEYEYGALKTSAESVEKVLKRLPRSIKARLLKSRILTDRGLYEQALSLLNALLREHPEEENFASQILRLEYRRGNFGRVVKPAPLANAGANVPFSTLDSSVSKGFSFEKRLLLARSLWADGQRSSAIKAYRALMNPSVEALFSAELKAGNLRLEDIRMPPLQESLWNRITFTRPEQPDPLFTVMQPAFVVDNIGRRINHVSAALYTEYRRQKLVESELSMREAVQRRDYHQAEREYRELLGRGGANDTLFDLASVYERLGLYGKEAEVYREIRKQGRKYPNLDERVRLNDLKRKPRVSLNYSFVDKEGRGGFIDMEKNSAGLEGRFMSALAQKWRLSCYRNTYASSDIGARKTRSNRIVGAYSSNFRDIFDFKLGLGAEDVNGQGGAVTLYDIRLLGKMDSLKGRLGFTQDIVDDTTEAVRRGIYYRDITAGITADILPRWLCGVDMRYRDYSDGNRRNAYQLWTSYALFGENDLLRGKYAYQSIADGKERGGADLPYWNPDEYWRHTAGIHFEHRFGMGRDDERLLSHYTVDYSLGLESGDQIIHSADFQIYLEISRDFLLKGTLAHERADEYESNGVQLSLVYRW